MKYKDNNFDDESWADRVCQDGYMDGWNDCKKAAEKKLEELKEVLMKIL